MQGKDLERGEERYRHRGVTLQGDQDLGEERRKTVLQEYFADRDGLAGDIGQVWGRVFQASGLKSDEDSVHLMIFHFLLY